VNGYSHQADMRAPKTKTAVRQDQIAKAALDLVAGRGLRALNVAALARKVGVVPSAIYRHYPSKEAVLDAVLKVIRQRLYENVEAVRHDFAGASERLDQLLQRHVEMVLGNQGIPHVVFSEGILSGGPARRRRVYQMIEGYLARIATIIREGQAEARIRPDLPPETVAKMFLGVIQTASILRLMSDGRFDAAKYRESAWPIFSGMLSNDHENEPKALPFKQHQECQKASNCKGK
jgi:AcrR family transcriptional regulator